MKEFFLKDSVLKVISFVIALFLWIYMIAIIDPSVDVKVRNIPIRYINETMIEERGLCLVNDEEMTMELKIRGSRKSMARIDSKNIYGTVDLSNVSKEGTVSLPIAVSIPYEYSEIVSKKPYYANVFIDKITTAKREVNVATTGNTANGYIAGTAVAKKEFVELKGASTVIDRIGAVNVLLDFDDRAAFIEDIKKPYFVDKNGKKIAEDDIIYDMVKMSEDVIEVECPVYQLKTVSVEINANDVARIGGYNVSIQPKNVTIYGEKEALEEVDKIETERLLVDEIDEEVAVGLNVPEGIFLRDGIREVTIKLEKKN